ncbi:DUF924 family protein [Roseococcus sp. YIM B11640]|uniref:DUF924 family protein n=1 Tax=Roseococcus sp. YIM B11640 TaxID=3133973 RepID=UPI003C7BE285
MSGSVQEILDFWFADGPDTFRQAWFQRDDAFDAEIRARFGHLVVPAREGALDALSQTREGALALILMLDQFPRNLFRGTAEAFASDAHAQALVRQLVLKERLDQRLTPTQRGFLYLPFEHAESMEMQNLSVTLYEGMRDIAEEAVPGGTIDYAWRHWHIIRRFGRFPHRNAALRRESTPAELAYLAQPGAGF